MGHKTASNEASKTGNTQANDDRTGNERELPQGEPNDISRRDFVKGASVASLASVIGYSASEPAAAGPSPLDTSKMTEVQVNVADGDEVSGIVENVNSGELLVFPSGTFSWTNQAVPTDVTDWGIRCQDDTVFEVPAGVGDDEKFRQLVVIDGDNYLLENLTFDSTGRAAPGIKAEVLHRAHFDGLEFRCDGPLSHKRHTDALNIFVRDPDGICRVDGFRQHNNADISAYAGGDSRVAFWNGAANQGTVRFVNPVLSGFPNNAFYTSRSEGPIIIEGGLLMNNNVSHVRMSGNVEVYDTTMVWDTDRYTDGPGTIGDGPHNTRGVWGDTRDGKTPTGGLVKNCNFVVRSFKNASSTVQTGNNDFISVQNCQWLLNQDILGCRATKDNKQEVIGGTFDGTATGSTAGKGDISGSGNAVNPDIPPGDLPVGKTSGYAFDWSRTHPETPDRQNSNPPVVDGLSITEIETADSDAEFDVAWQVSDSDRDLLSVELTLTDDTNSGSEDSVSEGVSGERASGTSRLVAAGDSGSGNSYTVQLVVTDSKGASASETISVSAIKDITSVTYNDDAIAVAADHYDTPDRAGVEFSISNVADQSLTITHVTVSPEDSTIDTLHDESNAVGPWVSELHVNADTQSGICDVPGSTSLPRTFDLANDGWNDTADSVAVLSAGSAASVALSRFEADGTPVDMVGKRVQINVDYRLVDGTTDTDSFTLTAAEPASPPSIDRYEVTEAGSKNPHANIVAEWDVSDADGDLSEVVVKVVDGSGAIVDSASSSIDGEAAYDVDYFELKRVDGQSFDVRATVSDSRGHTASETRTVTE